MSTGFPGVPPILHSLESYTIPNARCPVCCMSVFFYQSPYGCRVFFDELGPPWPKHPCTDNKSTPRRLHLKKPRVAKFATSRKHSWQREGWEPFFISNVSSIDKLVLKVCGKHLDHQKTVYINKKLQRIVLHPTVSNESIAYLRTDKYGGKEISLLSSSGEPLFNRAFELRAEAQAAGTDSRRRGGYVVATVQWYDDIEGYGFLQPEGSHRDVFLSGSTLKRSGILSVHKGDRVWVRVRAHPKGLRASFLKVM